MEWIVIIPALNPDERLRKIVDRNWELENQVILVDDGSDERYAQFFWELSEKCIVLHHRENRGKGAAIKTALRYIIKELPECSVIGIMDADGQHLPDDMERLLDFMLAIPGERYEYEMNVLVTCAKEEVPIIEIPIQTIYHDKDNSCSHFRKVRDSFRIYQQLLKFSLVSAFSFLLDYSLFVLLTLCFPKAAGWIMAANILARLLSGGYNYLLNSRLVFGEKLAFKTATDYAALALLILFLNNLVLHTFLSLLHVPVYPAKILTECMLFLISWLIQKKLIFQKEKTGPFYNGQKEME